MQSLEAVKFLLVDDVDENLFALDGLLRRDGLDLHLARSGRQALEMLLVHDFALAVLDVQMPEMDGFELAELIRSAERTRSVPIIFLTAVATDERRRFRGYEAGAVDYLLKPVDPQMLRNKAGVFFELARQRLELARQRDELRDSTKKLSRALSILKAHSDNSPLGIVEFDPDFRLSSWSKSAQRIFGWSAEQALGRQAVELGWLQERDAARLTDVAARILEKGEPGNTFACQISCQDGSVIESEWYFSVLADSHGRLVSVNAQILDVTERKRAEATQQLLISELNHRVKNTLATVQAIASQTLRHANRPEDFNVGFSGRLASLARAHSLLSETSWEGARLSKLVEEQQQLNAIDKDRLSVSGPDVHLPPQLALHLGLVLHELTTNAQKYGALAAPRGHIDLSWELAGGLLRVTWAETGLILAKTPPSRQGFGSKLIERSTTAEGGTSQMAYGPEGISWELSFALSHQNAYMSVVEYEPKPERQSGRRSRVSARSAEKGEMPRPVASAE